MMKLDTDIKFDKISCSAKPRDVIIMPHIAIRNAQKCHICACASIVKAKNGSSNFQVATPAVYQESMDATGLKLQQIYF